MLPFIYLGVNVACALVVLYASHWVASVVAHEQLGTPDGPLLISWALMSMPALLLAVLVNIAWLIKAVVDTMRRREYWSFVWLGAGILLWELSIMIAQHF